MTGVRNVQGAHRIPIHGKWMEKNKQDLHQFDVYIKGDIGTKSQH